MSRSSFQFNSESHFAVDKPVFAATMTPDAYRAGIHDILLTGNLTLNSPTNGVDGQVLVIRFIQDASGSRTWTPGTGFHLSSSVSSVALSSAASAVDIMTIRYRAAARIWDIVDFAKY